MNVAIFYQNLYGGTDLLLGRLSDWLKKKEYIVSDIKSESEIPEGIILDLIITPTCRYDWVFITNNKNTIEHVMVWVLGMGAFSDTYYNKGSHNFFDRVTKLLYHNAAQKALNVLSNNKALCFTDICGYDNTYLDDKNSVLKPMEKYLIPIGITIPEHIKKIKSSGADRIRVTWIGRVSSDFKEIPIKTILNDLEQDPDKYVLMIVGTGDAIGNIKTQAAKIKLNVSFVDNVPYAQIGDFLSASTDLFIGMGTAALDSAKNGIPTVIINPVEKGKSFRPAYRWIFESKGYSLGEYEGTVFAENQIRHSFNEIIALYREYGSEELGRKSFEYSKDFDEDRAFQRLLNLGMESGNDDDIFKCSKRFYSIKRSKNSIKKLLRKDNI